MTSRSSKIESSARRSLPATVMVGSVRRAHGLRGEILVELESDVPGRLDPGSALEVLLTTGERQETEIASSRPHRREFLVRLKGYHDRTQADTLRGAVLEVRREETPPAPMDSFYYFELVGCRCRDRREGELGQVTEIVEDGGGWLLVVDDGLRRVLIPLVRAYMESIDIETGQIDLNLPEGLIEACGSKS